MKLFHSLIATFCLSIVGLLICSPSVSAQVPVYDNANMNQRERMYMTKWSNFTPAWYFFLFHSEYKRKDKRPFGPNGPYLHHHAALLKQNESDKDYKESTETIREKAVVEELNSEGSIGDVAYSLYYEDSFSRFQSSVDNIMANQKPQVLAFLLEHQLLDWYNTEKGILDDRIKAIHQSYMERGSRILAYQRIEAEYSKLSNSFSKIVLLAKATVNAPVKSDSHTTDPLSKYKATNKTDLAISQEVLRYYKF